jgi:hypothetical protein
MVRPEQRPINAFLATTEVPRSFPSAGCPSLFAHFAKGLGFHGRLAHGIFRASRPAFFITVFLYRPHRHQITIAQ